MFRLTKSKCIKNTLTGHIIRYTCLFIVRKLYAVSQNFTPVEKPHTTLRIYFDLTCRSDTGNTDCRQLAIKGKKKNQMTLSEVQHISQPVTRVAANPFLFVCPQHRCLTSRWLWTGRTRPRLLCTRQRKVKKETGVKPD